jgi:hypothetical protein
MAHFAELDDNNKVLRVIVVNNSEILDENNQESEQKGIDFCFNLFGGRWAQTSYNGNMRKNYAGIDYLYDQERDAFIEPKPFESWILNEETCKWEPPVDYPILDEADPKYYTWDEATISWVEIPTE